MQRAITAGQRINPEIPKRAIPQSVLVSTSTSWIPRSFPTRTGRKKLSILPTMIPQYAARRIALNTSPLKARIIHAGTHTRGDPIIGIMERTIIINVQNTAPGIPTNQNPIPARLP